MENEETGFDFSRSFRFAREDLDRLSFLATRWRVSRSGVIRRLIAQAWQEEMRQVRKAEMGEVG